MATKDNGIILTQNDMKLIALGHRFTEGEKKVWNDLLIPKSQCKIILIDVS